jgi:hypothetical protein
MLSPDLHKLIEWSLRPTQVAKVPMLRLKKLSHGLD